MKPRLAETPEGLWTAFLDLCKRGKVGPDGRILYPAMQSIGPYFRFQPDGTLVKLCNGGMTYEPATQQEQADLEHDVALDTVVVYLMSRWGGSGRDNRSKPVSILHSPSGMSWKS